MAERTPLEIISNMTNIADSGQDSFVSDWSEFAKNLLRERGVSENYINGAASAYILSKIVSDMIDSGELSKTAESIIASLRVNHPRSGEVLTERHKRIVLDRSTNTVDFEMSHSSGAIIRIFVNGISESEGDDYTIIDHTIVFNGYKIAGTEIDVYIYG